MALTDEAQKLRDEINSKLRRELSGRASLDQLIVHTLINFAHRYLSGDQIQAEHWDKNTLGIKYLEHDMLQVLKTQNTEIRPSLIEMAKTHPKKENPYVIYSLSVRYLSWSESGLGELQVESGLDCGFPKFEDTSKKFEKTKKLKFDDPLEVRNKLPLLLEEVCSLF